jgi:hypothetical protein
VISRREAPSRERQARLPYQAAACDGEADDAAIDASRARYVPGLVLAEVDNFLRDDRDAMRAFIEDVERHAFLYAPPTDGQLTRYAA